MWAAVLDRGYVRTTESAEMSAVRTIWRSFALF